ncbi:T9SS type A sorting domain-containing protein, partial [Bacteroidota bacterium]
GKQDGNISINTTGGIPFTNGALFSIQNGAEQKSLNGITYPAPYGNTNGFAKHQILFRANELTSAGFTSGQMHSISLHVDSVFGTSVYHNLEIQIGTTSTTDLTYFESGLSTVYQSESDTIHKGWNEHVFTAPFVWNGTSNLVVQFCFNNLDQGSTANASTFYSSTAFNSVIWYAGSFNSCPYNYFYTSYGNKRPNTRFGVSNDSLHYKYLWNNGADEPSISELTSGSYSVIVTDANNCQASMDTVITETVVDTSVTVNNLTLTAKANSANYNWMDCSSGLIAQPNGQSFLVPKSGEYALIVEQDGCLDTSACYSFQRVGFDESLLPNFSLYPNPSDGIIYFDFGNYSDEIQFKIFNPNGKLVENVTLTNQTKHPFSLPEPKGIYFIQLILANGSSSSYKVIRQ